MKAILEGKAIKLIAETDEEGAFLFRSWTKHFFAPSGGHDAEETFLRLEREKDESLSQDESRSTD